MKIFSLFILLVCFSTINAQEQISGKYKNELGEVLILNADNTFEYSWRFDLASSWNVGTWSIKNKEKIYLKVKEIKDTLKTQNKIELVLSNDKISNEIANEEHIMNLLAGGGQSRSLPPKKLLLKNQLLFPYSKTGEVQNKKVRSLMDGSIFSKPWFEKISEK